eukprot:scaffold1593_cov193-Alexandrium_tamarense.AAC.11
MSSDEEDIDSIEESDEEQQVVVQKPKKKRKGKKSKDPNRPKRNMSAFFLYSNANRERVKGENPDAKFGDIVSGSCGARGSLMFTRRRGRWGVSWNCRRTRPALSERRGFEGCRGSTTALCLPEGLGRAGGWLASASSTSRR